MRNEAVAKVNNKIAKSDPGFIAWELAEFIRPVDVPDNVVEQDPVSSIVVRAGVNIFVFCRGINDPSDDIMVGFAQRW
jgi:hypothetical protein